MRGKQHPFPLTKDYLLKEYEDVVTEIGRFPGAPYHIETKPEGSSTITASLHGRTRSIEETGHPSEVRNE